MFRPTRSKKKIKKSKIYKTKKKKDANRGLDTVFLVRHVLFSPLITDTDGGYGGLGFSPFRQPAGMER